MLDLDLIDKKELDLALAEQKEKRYKRLGEILKEEDYIEESDVVQALEYQLKIARVDLDEYKINPELATLVPKKIAEESYAVPIKKEGDVLMVAMADPLDILTIDDIRFRTNCNITVRLASKKEIIDFLNRSYEKKKIIDNLNEKLATKDDNYSLAEEINNLTVGSKIPKNFFENKIVEELDDLLEDILNYSFELEADSIHIETSNNKTKIKYKIWGKLKEKIILPRNINKLLVYYLKFLSKLKIEEDRTPVNGIFDYQLEDKRLNLKAYFLPTIEGEKVVIKFLDQYKKIIQIEKMGFLEKQLEQIKRTLAKTTGLIVISGDKNSGKTTTMYSLLNSLKEKNIITIEEKIKCKLDNINQLQLNEELSLTEALDSVFDQEPEVIAVDNPLNLDKAALKMLLNFSLTGHLVFLTLKAEDVFKALHKIRNHFTDSFLLASSLALILNQKLVRKICTCCKIKDDIEFDITQLETEVSLENLDLYKANGCIKCKKTGYKGKTAIYEMLLNEPRLRNYIYKEDKMTNIRLASDNLNFNSYQDIALKKIKKEEIDLKELLRNGVLEIDFLK